MPVGAVGDFDFGGVVPFQIEATGASFADLELVQGAVDRRDDGVVDHGGWEGGGGGASAAFHKHVRAGYGKYLRKRKLRQRF